MTDTTNPTADNRGDSGAGVADGAGGAGGAGAPGGNGAAETLGRIATIIGAVEDVCSPEEFEIIKRIFDAKIVGGDLHARESFTAEQVALMQQDFSFGPLKKVEDWPSFCAHVLASLGARGLRDLVDPAVGPERLAARFDKGGAALINFASGSCASSLLVATRECEPKFFGQPKVDCLLLVWTAISRHYSGELEKIVANKEARIGEILRPKSGETGTQFCGRVHELLRQVKECRGVGFDLPYYTRLMMAVLRGCGLEDRFDAEYAALSRAHGRKSPILGVDDGFLWFSSAEQAEHRFTDCARALWVDGFKPKGAPGGQGGGAGNNRKRPTWRGYRCGRWPGRGRRLEQELGGGAGAAGAADPAVPQGFIAVDDQIAAAMPQAAGGRQ
ncbi:hypothetical protein BCR44DRAFT_407085 [Catenaria anguillulae PL171]|uniref:Uncharacterized protein n=1 Tax=Catenaria anguillulae PL171 TaxID=765915 RepID=A0A1Y2H9C5_9FUNG|nr:hypothetical protein BCR44DRAFT_407085 [Catenaria anguillulae PL171]